MTTTMETTNRVQTPHGAPLTGFTVGVTAARRSEEFTALLTRRGATVITAPAIRIIPLVDDAELERVSRELIERPAQVTVATTGIGFRGWMEAANGWGIADDLGRALAASRLLARGPKAKGAIRAADLREEWSPPSESSAEVLDHLLADGVAGTRIAVQLHGASTEWEPLPDFCAELRRAGADVVEVPVYRWTAPDDQSAMDRLIEATVTGGVDAVSFTSAPAVASMLTRADQIGLLDSLLAAFGADNPRRSARVDDNRARPARQPVIAVCVGPVTAAPLEALGVRTSTPARARLGSLARHIAEELPRRASTIHAGTHTVSVRGGCVVVDGQTRLLAPAAMALMRTLAQRPGRVVSREELLAVLPGGGGDTHAVETAIARLRACLGAPAIVQTVVKRGYRLAVDLGDLPVDGPRP